MILKDYFLFLFIILSFSVFSQNGEDLVIGHVDSIYSKVLDEHRTVWVHVPKNTRPDEKLPVVYLLDGSGHFYSVAGMIRQLSEVNGNTVVPKMIVVAINNTNRTRDLTPNKPEPNTPMYDSTFMALSGGGEKFLQFLENELIPTIEKKYPTSPFRTYIGHSLGGLTIMYTLFTRPDLFDAYICIDPSMWWDNQRLLKEIANSAPGEKYKGKKIFLGIANTLRSDVVLEEVKNDTSEMAFHMQSILALKDELENNKLEGLDFAWKFYREDSHGSVPLITEYDGFRHIFDFHNLNYDFMDKLDTDFDTYTYFINHYQKASEILKTKLKPEEFLVNYIGYEYIKLNKLEDAEKMFAYNVENYPESSNVYDSYGEVSMMLGQKERAITNYKKSLELNPGNQNAIDKLKEMGVEWEPTLKEIELSQEILLSYAGVYELMPGFNVDVTLENNLLFAQGTGQPKIKIIPKSENVFYSKEAPPILTFNSDDQGKVISLTVVQQGQTYTGQKIK